MTHENRVCDERLAAMLADARSEAERTPRDETVYDFEPEHAVAALTELQARRVAADGELGALHAALQRWRDADHESSINLHRDQIIGLIEEHRAALSPIPETQAGVTEVRGNQPQDIVIRLMNNPPDSWAGSVGDPGRTPYDQGWDAACKAILKALQGAS